tara:strand:- start:579 stop:761 length:183 start_codon:yes stop_codon:yes gene_type:complete
MRKIIIATVFAFTGLVLNAQPAKGNPGNAPTPFGFVELLIAAGAAYGGKKAYDSKKKRMD